MNRRKLQNEIMRAILRSSNLEYEDAYPLVATIIPQIIPLISRKEIEVELKKEEEKRKKREKNDFQKIGTKNVE